MYVGLGYPNFSRTATISESKPSSLNVACS